MLGFFFFFVISYVYLVDCFIGEWLIRICVSFANLMRKTQNTYLLNINIQ